MVKNGSMLSNEQIRKFQALYKNIFGKEISQEEAFRQGAKLIRLVELIYKPMTETEYQKLQERRQETTNLKSHKTWYYNLWNP